MGVDTIDYGKLVDEAMHVIVQRVLSMVQKNGLPGNHHFFISFITKFPGVKLSQALTNKYPREMTIVLQYQFQDLQVTDKGFQVTLSFNGVKEKIYIPFSAITTFADPSVQFGLQFREVDYHYSDEIDIEVETENEVEKLQTSSTSTKGKKGASTAASGSTSSAKGKSKDNNIVSLDKFRNKGKKKT